MNRAGRFLIRMALATLALGTLASAYLFGYVVGYKEAMMEWSFEPAIVMVSAERPAEALRK
jgi:hypothetical protein